jgi:TetR/AcrR family transcriptional regulator
MKDIAEVAKISKSVLFKYFSTKENLYRKLFRLASDSISEADDNALAEGEKDEDMFSLLRRRAKSRLCLFKEYPWIYRFSYTAAFDPDDFVRELVSKELEHYKKSYTKMKDIQLNDQSTSKEIKYYKGLREDISPLAAKQIIFWISQGYLEEKLFKDEIDPDQLEQGYAEWIDILEILLKDNKKL